MAVKEIIEAYRRLVVEFGPETVADAMVELLRSRWTALALALVLAREFVKTSDLLYLGASEASAYRAIRSLSEMGIIEPDEKVQVSRGGGPKTQIWRLSSHLRPGEDTLTR